MISQIRDRGLAEAMRWPAERRPDGRQALHPTDRERAAWKWLALVSALFVAVAAAWAGLAPRLGSDPQVAWLFAAWAIFCAGASAHARWSLLHEHVFDDAGLALRRPPLPERHVAWRTVIRVELRDSRSAFHLALDCGEGARLRVPVTRRGLRELLAVLRERVPCAEAAVDEIERRAAWGDRLLDAAP